MKRLLLAIAVLATLALAGSALATTTWSTPDGFVSQATTTTGTEAAPSSATQGLDLAGVGGFSVHVESACVAGDGGCTYPAFTAGTLLGYAYNPVSAKWNRAPDLDCSVAAGTSASCPGYRVSSARGRVAFVPSGLGSVAVNVYVVASR